MQRANINAAAKKIADQLNMEIVKRHENEAEKKIGFIRIQWWLADPNSERVGTISLECTSGYGAEGKSWAGNVAVYEASSSNEKQKTVGTSRLVDPWGSSVGKEACKKTRENFCEFASKFEPVRGQFV